MGTGESLEALVRRSAKSQESKGLRLNQTGARFVGKVGKNGKAKGRIVGKGELDFTGHLDGRYLTLDAKSTAIATSFALKLLKKHQVTILKNRHEEGACSFFLVEFASHTTGPQYYALTWPILKPYWTPYCYGGKDSTRASIPLAVFAHECIPISLVGKNLDLITAIQWLMGQRAA